MKRLVLLTILLVLLPMNVVHADAPCTVKVLKITVEKSNSNSFYAFVSPNHYYYREGHEEISGSKAENQVKKMEDNLDLTANTTAEKLVERLKTVVGNDLTGFDVRLLDKENHLYTWVWTKYN